MPPQEEEAWEEGEDWAAEREREHTRVSKCVYKAEDA